MGSESLVRPPEAAADWTIPQGWSAYTEAEHAMWDHLFQRQAAMLPSRVSAKFMTGLETLRLSERGIPDFEELSGRLRDITGWSVVAVPGLVPDDVFFEHLANRRFPAGNFIRTPDQIDYLQEPDVFHDVFGHVPLLADPTFADYMQAYGEGGRRAGDLGVIERLSRLYWYTVEFGLVMEGAQPRIYGAGIVSSYGESIFALEDASPNRIRFDLERIMRTDYRIDDYQQTYFVIESFEDLLAATRDVDFGPIYSRIGYSAELAPDDVLPTDRVISLGTQTHGRRRTAG